MKRLLMASALAVMAPALANAHFLLQYTENTMIERPGEVPVKLAFWHPMDNGPVMDLALPEAFYVIHRGERTDLLDTLQPVTFTSPVNSGAAFNGTVPVRRSGDYILVTVPQPYFDETEEIYIQQITKAFLNRNQIPTDWDQALGLPAEILPMTKPYNVIAGSSFTGRVLADGQPVPHAEIEVEYMAALPQMDRAEVSEPVVGPMPGGAIVIKSDANGYFSFAVPRAGHWGFAALGVGPQTEHDGVELSQDAVIWVRAWDMQ
ncbi:DUF4198 domain-containing protein [Tropicibacter naphthalenivorans]|uniref:Nickel uptake substrate-specific transmembrane region n=1 Tax=Tropicibacter naphthalenivorans TaxID=441103 RepID=A0A0P1GWT2_9RHOB|nr:DUF4198 domain-containing protein [Tropicibacter naphthalenivorans]CUH80808.1 Nickel uptake substrate-specific transmembrane region [Tropicibacter naphthalenivorans]SMC90337.1 cobalt/nickel transport protein [Tropicibacter naphthalenivorans]